MSLKCTYNCSKLKSFIREVGASGGPQTPFLLPLAWLASPRPTPEHWHVCWVRLGITSCYGIGLQVPMRCVERT